MPGVAEALASAAVSATGPGKALPVLSRVTVGLTSSVIGSWFRSVPGVNSVTVALTRTRLPTAAVAGGALLVKTKMPSDVAGSPSTSFAAVCRKKPLLN